MAFSPVLACRLEEPVQVLQPLKVKDIPEIKTSKPEGLHELINRMVKQAKASSGIIWNSFEELEQDELTTLGKDFPVPIFPIGPFHKYFPASSSSLLTQDQSCISWLDTQVPNSALYVSFGIIAAINEAEFQEIAWGLANSKQPFLWVVRPGLVLGSEWLEPLPDGFLEMIRGRGRIVKWAPQQEVLARPAIGGSFRDSLVKLLLDVKEEPIACLITDADWHFKQLTNRRPKLHFLAGQKAPNSVIYVSFGSIAEINEAEFLEIAWGLANSNQPFLWVVRPRLVRGSEWIEPLPDGFQERLGGIGHIVKWAPQKEVLAHPAIGGFWTHNGWNSTLESICEGVPMICHPISGDQKVNARYVTDIWRIGLHLEKKLERGEIERAVKRLIVEADGQEMRKRIMSLKEKVEICLKQGGSSYDSLERLTDYILLLQPLRSH
ncbi:hypothetical protein GH714_025888 [Hevea brasiliensis]|uniref:Anthocyanidin 3-O-glucosyltransferase n=1 Tax=Hevea brasiliensis TaxID=3981 RepID=A0A6A6L0P1_HEVBR|nr:hypothetical protein GH714_025888 [Hevea brasiliensis]